MCYVRFAEKNGSKYERTWEVHWQEAMGRLQIRNVPGDSQISYLLFVA